MFEFIKGKIIELTPTSIIIETGNIGYILAISLNTYSSLVKTENCKLYIYESIREDAHQLFGFIDKQERQLFLYLISVSGIGSNTARMILSSLSVCELKKIILSNNVSALKAIKGIGSKTAERIIIELKDKVKSIEISINTANNAFSTSIFSELFNEAIAALVMLGFNQSTSKKVVTKIINNNPNFTTEQIIKNALKLL